MQLWFGWGTLISAQPCSRDGRGHTCNHAEAAESSTQWRRVHRQPGRDEISADWSLLEKVDRGLCEWSRHTEADNQQDSHVCRARSLTSRQQGSIWWLRYSSRCDLMVALSPLWLSTDFCEDSGNLLVMLHIHSAAYSPTLQNNSWGLNFN